MAFQVWMNFIFNLSIICFKKIFFKFFRVDNEKNSRMNQNNIEECGSECDVNVPNSAPKVRQRRNRRKLHQVNQNIDLMNGRLNVISVPDELLFKLNAISGDLESAARLFTAILPTKNSYLQIISGQKYIENSVPEPVEV